MEAVSKFQQWYFTNGYAWNARRALRYQNDPAYRERILARKRSRYKANAPQRQYKTTIFGQVVRAYEISEASAMIGKTPSTIRQWELTGLIPPSVFPMRRLYTQQQISLLRDIAVIMALSTAKHTDNAKIRDRLAVLKIKIYDQWNEMEAYK